jgi:hypothetical protein
MMRERHRNKRWHAQAEQAQEDAKHQPPLPQAIRFRPPGSPTSPDAIFEPKAKKRS